MREFAESLIESKFKQVIGQWWNFGGCGLVDGNGSPWVEP